MRLRSGISLLVAALLLSVLVQIAPGAPDADAQGVCTDVASESQLRSCVAVYESSGGTVEMTLGADIPLADSIILRGVPDVIFAVDGKGFKVSTLIEGTSVFIQISGHLELNRTQVTAPGATGILALGGKLTVTNSTFDANKFGIVMVSTEGLVVENSTIALNDEDGIFLDESAMATILQTTIVGNGESGIQGGGDSTATITGSIIAQNGEAATNGPDTLDCLDIDITDGTGNAFGDLSCTGTNAAGIESIVLELVDECGTICTPTLDLPIGSPAIDRYNCEPDTLDQRGNVRAGGSCDAGSVEVGGAAQRFFCEDVPVTIFLGEESVQPDFDGVYHGTDGDDVILGTEEDEIIDGGLGNDTICGQEGNDQIYGGGGDDVLFGHRGQDKLYGGSGLDTIRGGDDDDVIHGNRGNDILNGEDGNDRIFGYADDDLIDGGPGDDRLHGNFGDDSISGGPGDDRIFGYGNNDRLFGDAGNDVIGGNFGDDVIGGGPGNDRAYGSDGSDEVDGGDGNDLVEGNSGTDVVKGGPGSDRLDGGINRDTCDGGPGTDTATRCEDLIAIP